MAKDKDNSDILKTIIEKNEGGKRASEAAKVAAEALSEIKKSKNEDSTKQEKTNKQLASEISSGIIKGLSPFLEKVIKENNEKLQKIVLENKNDLAEVNANIEDQVTKIDASNQLLSEMRDTGNKSLRELIEITKILKKINDKDFGGGGGGGGGFNLFDPSSWFKKGGSKPNGEEFKGGEKPKVSEERYKYDEKANRWRDTEKGRGGGQWLSNAEQEKLNLPKTGPSAAGNAAEKGILKTAGKYALGAARAIPFLGDIAIGGIEGYNSGSIGQGLAAGAGSLVGRTAGAFGGGLVGGPVGAFVGETAGSAGGAELGVQAYKSFFGNKKPETDKAAAIKDSTKKLTDKPTSGINKTLNETQKKAIDWYKSQVRSQLKKNSNLKFKEVNDAIVNFSGSQWSDIIMSSWIPAGVKMSEEEYNSAHNNMADALEKAYNEVKGEGSASARQQAEKIPAPEQKETSFLGSITSSIGSFFGGSEEKKRLSGALKIAKELKDKKDQQSAAPVSKEPATPSVKGNRSLDEIKKDYADEQKRKEEADAAFKAFEEEQKKAGAETETYEDAALSERTRYKNPELEKQSQELQNKVGNSETKIDKLKDEAQRSAIGVGPVEKDDFGDKRDPLKNAQIDKVNYLLNNGYTVDDLKKIGIEVGGSSNIQVGKDGSYSLKSYEKITGDAASLEANYKDIITSKLSGKKETGNVSSVSSMRKQFGEGKLEPVKSLQELKKDTTSTQQDAAPVSKEPATTPDATNAAPVAKEPDKIKQATPISKPAASATQPPEAVNDNQMLDNDDIQEGLALARKYVAAGLSNEEAIKAAAEQLGYEDELLNEFESSISPLLGPEKKKVTAAPGTAAARQQAEAAPSAAGAAPEIGAPPPAVLPQMPKVTAENAGASSLQQAERAQTALSQAKEKVKTETSAPGGGGGFTPRPSKAGSDKKEGGLSPVDKPQLASIKTKSGKSAQVAAPYAKNFQGFIDDLEATGYKINSIGGYADRANVNNPKVKSYHAMGAAIDINPGSNPNKSTKTDLPPETGALAAKNGLGWGMNWKSVKDPMHFSAAKGEQGSFDVARGSLGSVAPGEVQGSAATGGDSGGGNKKDATAKNDTIDTGAGGGGAPPAMMADASPSKDAAALNNASVATNPPAVSAPAKPSGSSTSQGGGGTNTSGGPVADNSKLNSTKDAGKVGAPEADLKELFKHAFAA